MGKKKWRDKLNLLQNSKLKLPFIVKISNKYFVYVCKRKKVDNFKYLKWIIPKRSLVKFVLGIHST